MPPPLSTRWEVFLMKSATLFPFSSIVWSATAGARIVPAIQRFGPGCHGSTAGAALSCGRRDLAARRSLLETIDAVAVTPCPPAVVLGEGALDGNRSAATRSFSPCSAAFS